MSTAEPAPHHDDDWLDDDIHWADHDDFDKHFDPDHYPTVDVSDHHYVLVDHHDRPFVIVNNRAPRHHDDAAADVQLRRGDDGLRR